MSSATKSEAVRMVEAHELMENDRALLALEELVRLPDFSRIAILGMVTAVVAQSKCRLDFGTVLCGAVHEYRAASKAPSKGEQSEWRAPRPKSRSKKVDL